MKIVKNEGKNIIVEVEQVGNSHYLMKYQGDYGFDAYLAKGVNNLEEYIEYMEQNVLADSCTKKKGMDFGCAAFLARNAENEIILGRNMDCECGIGMLVRTQEKKAYQSIALTNMCELDWDDNTYDTLEEDAKLTLAAPYSPSDGINEHGLCVAILSDWDAIYPTNHAITLLDMSIPRLLLNQAKNVEEAIQIMQKYNLFYLVAPLHYMIADAEGNSVVIEYVDGNMVTTRNQDQYQVVTNYTLYHNPEQKGFGKDRFDQIETRLQQNKGVITEKDALELLKKNVIPGDEQWSAVYNLTKKSVQIAFSKAYDMVYEYQL